MSVDTVPLPPDGALSEAVNIATTAPAVWQQQADVNPFPRVIKTANYNGNKVRLIQDQKDNEMQIQFGEGTRQDKPSGAVLTYMHNHLVPTQVHTVNERNEGRDVPGFRFGTEKGCWCARMRNQPNITRTKAEDAFNGAVRIIGRELGQRAEERSEGVPF
jgi:hypothetical protein